METMLYQKELTRLLQKIVADDALHGRFLNTLSLLENTGARKISRSESNDITTLMILKHAVEEHRHAYYLKKQIEKLRTISCPTYASQYLLSSVASKQYLNRLDISVSRYLKNTLQLTGSKLRYFAYLLVTYAIELRADSLYPIYQEVLTDAASKVSVKSIILEEQGHLEEMISQLSEFSSEWREHALMVIGIETRLFEEWTGSLKACLESFKPILSC